MKTNCIINLSTGRFIRGQQRLIESLNDFDGEVLTWVSESQINSPLHKDNPYAFKIYAFEEALRQGFKRVLWVDASIYAAKPLETLWDSLDKGYMIQHAGHWTGTWSNDRTLNYFDVTRDEAMKMPMFHGGFIALDFDNIIARDLYDLWAEAMLNGMFKGEWTNTNKTESQDTRCEGHRHDMTSLSIIANQMNLESSEPLLAYVGDSYNEPPDSSVMYAEGIV
jgi:hypothetical protein